MGAVMCSRVGSLGSGCDDPSCRLDHGDELPFICQWCEEPCATLTRVDDSDAGVGYKDDLEVCDTCLRKYGKH